MSERIVYLNGMLVPESGANVSILDRGFLYGDSVYDSSRTFDGKPWRLREHIERLYESCAYAQLLPDLDIDAMESITAEVIERNKDAYASDEEFRINHWVTRGGGVSYDATLNRTGPTVVVFTLPLDYERFADGYIGGVECIVPQTRRTPPQCVSPRAKVGNKMNHMQAEFEAKAHNAWAIMLDLNGRVAEGPSYNCFFVRDGEILTPSLENCLSGVNRSFIFELAGKIGIVAREAELEHADLHDLDEAFNTGNSICLLPVSSIDGVALRHGAPGPITERLVRAWVEEVGSDWRAKALETRQHPATP